MCTCVSRAEDCLVLDRDIEKESCKNTDHMSMLIVDDRTIVPNVADWREMEVDRFLIISLPNQRNSHDNDRDNIVLEVVDIVSWDWDIDQEDCNSIMYKLRFQSREESRIDFEEEDIMFRVVWSMNIIDKNRRSEFSTKWRRLTKCNWKENWNELKWEK